MRSSINAMLTRERRGKYLRLVLPIVLVIILFLYGALGLLSHLNGFELQKVIVSGNKALSQKVLEDAVWQKLSGRYALIFSKKNTFIFPKSKIGGALLAEFPRLKSAKVEFADYHSIRVHVEERDSVALWCGTAYPMMEAREGCFLLDTDGLIFDSAPHFSRGLYVQFFGPIEERGGSAIGSHFLKDKLMPLRSFLAELASRGLSAEITHIDTHQDVTVIFDSGTRLIFTLPETSYTVLREDLNTIALALKEKSTPLQSVDYIDMRFPGKAFYKLR